MAWTSLSFSFGSLLTSSKMTQLYDNITAVANGDSGAPAITEAAMDSASVNQAALKSTTGEVSVTLSSVTTAYTGAISGGEYQLGHSIRTSGGSMIVNFLGLAYNTLGSTYVSPKGRFECTFYTSGTSTNYLRNRYIQASPPYDLGDGQVHDFIFVKLNRNGEVLAAYDAPDAPWHYNGPTEIKADRYDSNGKAYKKVPVKLAEFLDGGPLYEEPSLTQKRSDFNLEQMNKVEFTEIELSQAYKNMDMDLCPHPFGELEDGETVVMIDPVSSLNEQLANMRASGGSAIELLHDGLIIIENNKLNRAGPTGLDIVSAKWRNARGR